MSKPIFARIIKSASMKPGTLVRLMLVSDESVMVQNAQGRVIAISGENLEAVR